MAVRIAINGFGRIGRNILRAIVESGRTDVDVVGVNDLGPIETNAHLLRFDSVHGRFPHEVKVDGDHLVIGRHRIRVTAVKDPATLPWKELNVDIAMECTGIFTSRDKAAANGKLKGILGYTDAPNVSIDFNHDPHSSTFALDQTKVMDGNLLRILTWYDNEWGFSNRMSDTAVALAKFI